MSDKPEFIEAEFQFTQSTVRFSLEDALDFLYKIAEVMPKVVVSVAGGLEEGRIAKCPFPRECDEFPCNGFRCSKPKTTETKKIQEEVEKWYRGGIECPIHEFLGMTLEEYSSFEETGRVPKNLRGKFTP